MREPPPLTLRDLGRLPYEQVWALQKELVQRRLAGEEGDLLLVVEHEPVVTRGRGSAEGEHVADAFADGTPVRVVDVERGGQATYHGPGQLVVYPIVRLADDRHDLHGWMRALEQAAIATARHFGVDAGLRAGATGVWVDQGERKLASIGVAVSRWVTYHGMAFNRAPDLSHFTAISPCGFEASVMTSLAAELGGSCPSREQTLERLVAELTVALAPFRG